MVSAEHILQTALDAVTGARRQTHGDALDQLENTADLWTTYLGDSLNTPVTGRDVAIMMVLMKASRAKCGDAANIDHYVDMCGYAAIAGRIASEPVRSTKDPLKVDLSQVGGN